MKRQVKVLIIILNIKVKLKLHVTDQVNEKFEFTAQDVKVDVSKVNVFQTRRRMCIFICGHLRGAFYQHV